MKLIHAFRIGWPIVKEILRWLESKVNIHDRIPLPPIRITIRGIHFVIRTDVEVEGIG